MRERPKLLIFTCIVMAGIIISIPLQVLLQTNPTAINLSILLQQITIFNWAVVISCITTMILAINGHRLLSLSIFPLLALIHINNFFVYKFAIHTEWYLPVFASIFATGVATLFLVNKSIKYTALNPDKRWWLIPKRYQKTLPIWIELDNKQCVLAHTFDLSKTGTFISTIDGVQRSLTEQLELGKEVKILIGDKNDVEFSCNASVVRKAEARGNYPSGVGLHFDHVPLVERFRLSKILNNPTLGL